MMKYTLAKALWVLLAVATLSSCHISRKQTDKHGRVIIVKEGRKDNGLHKGWYKNPNNPHHPRTTNPGHTKHKGKGKTTVIVKGHNAKGGGTGKGGGSNGKGKKGKH